MITNEAEEIETTSKAGCRIYFPDKTAKEDEDILIHEHFMDIEVNGITAVKLSCTPEHLTELVMGRLFTEGIIDGREDIKRLHICAKGRKAHVILSRDKELIKELVTEPTCCAGNKQLVIPARGREINKTAPAEVDKKAVFLLAERFREDTALHSKTRGTHSCYLYLPDGNIEAFEDISRHNAMDKAVGHAVLNGVDLSACMLYTTGRVPEDMVIKALFSGVKVLISKSVPTDAAVELALKNGLKLIYSAWPDSFKVVG